ncbi:hypothetical protein BD410DRAFT_844580 [Rickenella mellea]|uniref:Uncharacterized protein n=1 Tax=Rickenella mellea TaxID=50990 RepID=A0A4Y7PP22_9AGAM|nr:hypothetical protein BD410DRAFT_844580 [Rickenella mellea]
MAPNAKSTDAQPQAVQMVATAAPANKSQQEVHEEHQQKAMRLRGGGAGKDCFLGLVGCFLCFGSSLLPSLIA